MATDDPTMSVPSVRKKKRTSAKWQEQNTKERAEKAEILEALRQAPPDVVLNLTTYPTRLKHSCIVAHCAALGNPGVKQRPRFVRADGTVFTPKATKESERDIGWTVKLAMRELLLDGDAAFGLRLVFYVRDGQRKDIDNMTKLVFDGITGIAWADDSQVKELFAWIIEDPAHPRTEIMIYKLGYAIKEYSICAVCHQRFRVYPSWIGRPYCSRTCASFAQRNRVIMTCAHCGKSLERIASNVNRSREYFCSLACKSLHHSSELTCAHCHTVFRRANSLIHQGQKAYCSATCRDKDRQEKRTSRPAGICIVCGSFVTRKAYTHCITCRHLKIKEEAS